MIIGETSKYADFILPDLAYLESWNAEDIFPILKHKFAGVIQPVTRVVPDARPTEQVYIDLLKGLGLPGVGDNALADGSAIHTPEDYYLKRIANIAFDGQKPVKDANAEELAIFEKARKKALGKYFDIQKLKDAVKPDEWKKVVYVLNRGGRFEAAGDEYIGNKLKYQWAKQVYFYDEKAAGFKSAYTGKFFEGVPVAEEIKTYDGEVYKPNKPLQFINWKSRNMATHRTEGNTWLREIKPENYVWINPIDAKKKGIKTDDEIYISSNNSKVKGRALVTPGINQASSVRTSASAMMLMVRRQSKSTAKQSSPQENTGTQTTNSTSRCMKNPATLNRADWASQSMPYQIAMAAILKVTLQTC
ncbi:tetrathionate reductase subunit A [Mesobacillus boroniphilus JCM 21738]|uniref:Tetrathionate reductase subunit A n=1 Tax=Mesobacillus boroniphilus JCM 21738 TaxID=1294265 RepID=W4RHM6_9BACI|nr:tetrathionate reductase subunit A [Mesobacillus boroniphilus JCM 21738]